MQYILKSVTYTNRTEHVLDKPKGKEERAFVLAPPKKKYTARRKN